MIVQWNIEYLERRCHNCGSFYAIEKLRGIGADCPFCLQTQNERLRRDLLKADRKIAALKGCLKARKNA